MALKEKSITKTQRNKIQINTKDQTTDIIVNLGQKDLTESSKNILKKGLKFIPTPKSNNIHTCLNSFIEFKRRMLLQYHFRHQNDKTIPIFRVKSHWEPPEYTFKPLTKYFNNVLTDITKLYRHPTRVTNH